MKNQIVVPLVVVILVAAAVAFWFVRPKPTPVAPVGVVGGGSAMVNAGNFKTVTPDGYEIGGTVSFGTTVQPPADPEFQKWLSGEAKDVDQPQVDSLKKRTEIARVVSALTPAQAHQLLQTALNDKAPASEKILSVYLLGEGGARTREELAQLIATPLPDRGPITPHSDAEIQSSADKARLLMSIDALATQAKTDPAARSLLVAAISHIQDPYVRAQAQKRLSDLPAH